MSVWLLALARGITCLNHGVFRCTVWAMAVIVPVMLYEVVARYVFNAPTVWAMELAILIFGPYFLLGGPYLLHLNGHVSLDVFRMRLSPKWNRRFELVNYPIIIAFCLILLYYSVPAAYSAWQYGETSFSAWNPPIWPAKLAVPLSLALLALQAVADLITLVFSQTDKNGHGVTA